MRRGTQRVLAQLAVFISVLLLILFINRPQSGTETFAWTKIRYTSSSPAQSDVLGICPGLEESSKPALVVSRVTADGDSSWLEPHRSLYHLCIYNVDAPFDSDSKQLQVPANRGHEAMAYLTFIIDNYDNLPTAGMVFVHGTRFAWHNDHPDYDNLALLTSLNVSAALTPLGYHNMRCDWSTSTCLASAKPQGGFEITMQAATEPWNARAVSDKAIPLAFASLFGGDRTGLPTQHQQVLLSRTDTLRSQCCAQFVVSRENVWKHSRQEYVALRQWLLDGSDGSHARKHSLADNAAPADDRVAGRILSYMWHLLFLTEHATASLDYAIDLQRLNQLACPTAEECYCRLYGRCDLDCRTTDRCVGQYHVPPGYKLPEQWSSSHG